MANTLGAGSSSTSVAPINQAAPSDPDNDTTTVGGTSSTQAFGDSAVNGVSTAAAASDHKHAMMADPTTGTGWQGAYASGTTYAKNAIVTGSDSHCYISMSASNHGNDPTTDAGVHWHALNS